jgi:hypothetical protein
MLKILANDSNLSDIIEQKKIDPQKKPKAERKFYPFSMQEKGLGC